MKRRQLGPGAVARLVCIAVGVGVPAGIAGASESVMSFESLAHAGNTVVMHGNQYEEDGFRLTVAPNEFGTYGSGAFNYPGSTALIAGPGTVVTLSQSAGAAFDLLSIEIAKRDTSGSIFPVNVTFTGTKSDSSTVTATFHGTVSGVLLQNFLLPDTFTDLTQVTWSGTQPHQFDNVTVVPAPGLGAVFVAAGCLALRRRR